MKIQSVVVNTSDECVELKARGKVYTFPFSEMGPRPTAANPIRRAFVDSRLAREAITYVLYSGEEGAVHIEHAMMYSKR